MTVSVIIPTLNEAPCLPETLRTTRQLHAFEIIVVDGGSYDATLRLAQAADMVLQCERGRARQQNAGARAARGDVLLFLHADCRLEPGALEAIAAALRRPGVIAGCFTQSVAAPGVIYRLIERGNAMRARLAGIAYGDQGIFVRRDSFFACGGFPDVQLMEDLFFMKRLRRRGRVVVLPDRLRVSARRWQNVGPLRQTLRNWALTFLAHVFVHPDRLARFYPDVRARG